MYQNHFHNPHVIKRMHQSYFGEIFNDYISHLDNRGHRLESIQKYSRAVEHFGQWLKKNKVPIGKIRKPHVDRFLIKHLPICRCEMPATHEVKMLRAAIHQLFFILDAGGAVENCNVPDLIKEYEIYLSNVCGFSTNTRIYRKRYAYAFLKSIRNRKIENIAPKHIMSFVKEYSKHYKRGSVGVVSTSLRSFIKFLIFQGYRVTRLLEAVPNVANYKLSGVPSFLTGKQIQAFLTIFNLKTASGKRDYAMARCLIDLGLRCCEVAGIKLSDINWREGILIIAKGKSHCIDQLPMPSSVGEAISDYLMNARPDTQSKYVFVFHRAPFGKSVSTGTVRGAMRRVFERAGFDPVPSTHIFRHSFATKLLNSGSTIKEIADMLRHRCIDTTMIYTKVDLPHLRKVTMPWFGRK